MSPTGPFRLVTVNTAPDRARRLIGRVVADVSEQYTIIHAANAASTPPLHPPLLLFCFMYFHSFFIMSILLPPHLPPLPSSSQG